MSHSGSSSKSSLEARNEQGEGERQMNDENEEKQGFQEFSYSRKYQRQQDKN